MAGYHRPSWAPDDAEIEKPSAARMYDYYLDGSHNFAADRALAEQYIQVLPEIKNISWANRYFLRRAVTCLVQQGIDQFLDLGSGMPTVGNVHEVALALNPGSRVVYADADLVTVSHGQALLASEPAAAYLHADLRNPESVLQSHTVTEHLDLSRPVGILMVAVLHFVPEEDDPADIVATYRDAVVPGSHLVVSHATHDYHPETMRRASGVYDRASHSMNFRSHEEIGGLLDGFELLSPGLVDVINWRPGPTDKDPYNGDVTRYNLLAAVGRR
jgi:SAM-dependent methyltransferase